MKDRIRPLVDQLFREIPTGVGQSGHYPFDKPKLMRLMAEGASYVVGLGYGSERDLLVTEAGGCLEGADPGRVSDRAIIARLWTSAARSGRATTSSRSRSSIVSSTRPRPRSWVFTKARSPS